MDNSQFNSIIYLFMIIVNTLILDKIYLLKILFSLFYLYIILNLSEIIK